MMDKSEFLFKGQGKLASWPLSGMQQTVFHLTGEKDKEWGLEEQRNEGRNEWKMEWTVGEKKAST